MVKPVRRQATRAADNLAPNGDCANPLYGASIMFDAITARVDAVAAPPDIAQSQAMLTGASVIVQDGTS
jgi:hypothetical protein